LISKDSGYIKFAGERVCAFDFATGRKAEKGGGTFNGGGMNDLIEAWRKETIAGRRGQRGGSRNCGGGINGNGKQLGGRRGGGGGKTLGFSENAR